MPKASTFALKTAANITDADTIVVLPNAGDPVRLPIPEARQLLGLVGSDTVSAYYQVGATKELKIQAAIDFAALNSKDRVFVPSSMLPYDPTAVTFNTAVQMVREGGSFDGDDIRAYGATGNGSAQDRPALVAADAAVVARGGGFIDIPVGSFRIGSTTTVTSSLRFLTGGMLVPDAGVTITMNGSFNADKEQKFAGLGTIILGEGSMGEVSPTWFELPGATDQAIALNKAIGAIAATGGAIVISPRAGGNTWLTPVNMTTGRIAQGLRLIGQGPQSVGGGLVYILVKHTGVGIDLTGSNDATFENITLVGDATTTPKCGWLLAREGPANGSAGRHRFINCRSRGCFSGAVVWSYGSEENDYSNSFFFNTQVSGKVIVLTASNRTDVFPSGMASSFVTIATGQQSNLIHNFFGGSYAIWNGPTADVFYLENASSVNFYGGWALAGDQTGLGPGRSIIYVDGTVSTSDFVHITGFHGENFGSGLQQKFFVLFGNEGTRTHLGWSMRDARPTCGDVDRTVAIGTTSASATITSAGLFLAKDQGAVITGTGIPAGTRILSVTNASAAVLTQNATATGSPTVTLGFRAIFAPPNVTLDTLHIEQSPEGSLMGYEFSTLTASTIIAPNSRIIAALVNRSKLIGNPANWTLAGTTASILFDDLGGSISVSTNITATGRVAAVGSVNAAAQLRATGWYNAGDSTGPGMEIGIISSAAWLFAFDRTAGTYYPLRIFGSTIALEPQSAPVSFPASVAAFAPMRVPHGTAPTSPVNGDMWTTTAGLFVRVNGVTVGPLT